jgi:hypothetical protein
MRVAIDHLAVDGLPDLPSSQIIALTEVVESGRREQQTLVPTLTEGHQRSLSRSRASRPRRRACVLDPS